MDEMLRTARGLLGVAATWAVAWGAIGALVGLVLGVLAPELWRVANPIVGWALGMAAYGAVSGLGFGGLLAYHERRSTLAQLTPARAGVWGVLGAVAAPMVFLLVGMFDAGTTALDVVEAMALTAFLGGTFAAGSVALARRVDAAALDRGDHATLLEPERTGEPDPRPARERARRPPG